MSSSTIKYRSPSTENLFCTPQQYLTELLIIRRAKRQLPAYFWRMDKWKKQYKQTIFWVQSLFKTYRPEAVIRAFNRKDMKHVYSIKYPGLDDIIQEEQKKMTLEEAQQQEINVADTESKPMKPKGTKSQLSKLREL